MGGMGMGGGMGGTLPRTSSARTLQLREPFLSPSSRSASRPASSVVWVPPVVGYYREGVCVLPLHLPLPLLFSGNR